MLGFRAIGVLPERGGRVDAIGGWPDAGNSLSSQFDVGWFATQNLLFNAIATTTHHEVHVRGSVLGDVYLGHV